MPDIGRNDPCHCGSGKKYKKCCLAKDEAKELKANEKQWAEAEKKFAKEKEKEESEAAPEGVNPGFKKPVQQQGHVQKHNTIAAPKFNMPRKAGGGG